MRILAIPGSLRAVSANLTLLRRAAALAPPEITVELFPGLGELPPFNPDLDREGTVPPAPVAAFRALIGAADALLIASPEYAHGVPGTLKNALDWLVSSEVIVNKPVALLNASETGGHHARTALEEILRTMSVRLPAAASLPQAPGRPEDPVTAEALRRCLSALRDAIRPAA